MLPNGIRNSYVNRQYNSPNKNTIIRNSYSLNARPLIDYNNSPRPISDLRSKNNNVFEIGQKMRLMKSRINNLSIYSRNGVNQNNLYPTQLVFLLSNQESNVDHMRKLVEQQKKRVNRDFDNFTREIVHLIQDLKLSFHSQLDFVFRDFINLYGNLKEQIIRLRQNRRRIIHSSPSQQYNNKPFKQQAYPIQYQNNQNFNNVSNLNFLQEISRDQDNFKNHKIYQQITNAYFQAIGPIMTDTQNILSIGSQLQFYKDQKCNQVLNNIRNNFFQNTKIVFQTQLNNLVLQTKQIIQDNNMLLKDLNLEDPKIQKSNYQNPYGNQKQSNIGSSNGNNFNQVSNVSKKKKFQTEGNPYGFQQLPPTLKNHFYQENQKPRGLRPSSSIDHLKYRSRPQSQWSNKKRDIQAERQKFNINMNINPVNQISQAKIQKNKVTKDQQGIIVQWTQSPRLIKNNTLNCSFAQDILLCILFVNQGKNIAVGSKDKNIYIFSVQSGMLIQTLSGHKASVCSLANFGNFFASGGDNGCSSLILWQTQQWKMKRKVSLHSAALTCIVDMLDGSHLATGGYDKKIQIYNYKKSEPIFEVNSCRSGVTSLIVCQPARKLISAGLDSTMTIWNIYTKNGQFDTITLQRIVTTCDLICSLRPLILWPDTVLVGNKDGKIILLNINTGQIIKTLMVGKGSIIQLAVVQRHNKPQSPIVLSSRNGERELFFTKSDTGTNESSNARINIIFGCGVGPKVILDESGDVAIVNQSSVQKQVVIYKMQFS